MLKLHCGEVVTAGRKVMCPFTLKIILIQRCQLAFSGVEPTNFMRTVTLKFVYLKLIFIDVAKLLISNKKTCLMSFMITILEWSDAYEEVEGVSFSYSQTA